MTVNYSKVSIFLILFLIWNIVSGLTLGDLIYDRSITGYYIYNGALWTIWFFASLIFALIYIFDSRKNKTPNTRSRVADFLIAFILSLTSLFLVWILIPIADIDKFARIGTIPYVFFIWTPFYFFILRHNWPSKNKVFNILAAFLVASFFVFLLVYLAVKYPTRPLGTW